MQPGFARCSAQKEEAALPFLKWWALSYRYLFISKWIYLFLDCCSQARKCWLATMQTYRCALNFDPALPLCADSTEKYPNLSLCWKGWFCFARIHSQNQRQFQKCLAWTSPQCRQRFAAAVPFNSAGRQLSPLLSSGFSLVSPDTQFSLLDARSCTSKALSETCLVS